MTTTHTGTLNRFGVFHLPLGSTLRDAAETLSRIEPGNFRKYDAFAYVFCEPIVWDSSEAQGVRNYEGSRPHFVVDRDAGRERIRQITTDGLLLVDSINVGRGICESDLMDLMFANGSSCALEPSGNYHFVTPSLMHTDRFIRIGDLVRNRETLDRLAYWIEQRLERVQGVLVDSWSISAVALRALQRLSLNIPFDCIPEHPVQNPDACKAVIESLVSRMGGVGKLMILVSINGSGQLLRQVQSILEPVLGEITVENLSLYGFASTPSEFECLARIDDKGTTDTDDHCSLCAEGSIAIPIDPTSYHLRSWRESHVSTGESHFIPGWDFINEYSSVEGLFFLHRNDQSDNRHHAYDVDVSRLLELPSFQAKLSNTLAQFKDKVDLLVVPNHAVGRKLAQIVAAILDVRYVIHDTLNRTTLGGEEISALRNARHVLVVDDTLNSGSRIHRYIQGFREGDFGNFTNIDVLVGMARPETMLELNRISSAIANRHPWQGKLHHVELLLLPRWGSDACPWCKEFDLLSRLEELYGRPPKWLTDRTQELRIGPKGISNHPVLLLPGIEAAALAAGSPICAQGTQPMPLTFAVASGLQRHRSDPANTIQLHPDFPLSNVLSPAVFATRYTEGIIRAVLLQNLTRHELGSQASIETRNLLLREMTKDNQRIVSGALISAFGRRSFPPISHAKFTSRFSGFMSPNDLENIAAALVLPKLGIPFSVAEDAEESVNIVAY